MHNKIIRKKFTHELLGNIDATSDSFLKISKFRIYLISLEITSLYLILIFRVVISFVQIITFFSIRVVENFFR